MKVKCVKAFKDLETIKKTGNMTVRTPNEEFEISREYASKLVEKEFVNYIEPELDIAPIEEIKIDKKKK